MPSGGGLEFCGAADSTRLRIRAPKSRGNLFVDDVGKTDSGAGLEFGFEEALDTFLRSERYWLHGVRTVCMCLQCVQQDSCFKAL